MPTCRCEIQKTGDTFVVRFYDNGNPHPVDCYECHQIKAAWDVVDSIADSADFKEDEI
jgi:hypothetical protein